MISSFPFSCSDEFNSRPLLVSSLDRQDGLESEPPQVSGRWNSGDVFFLMTDALAAWCLRGVEGGEQVIDGLCSVETQGQFESLVAELRGAVDDEGLPRLKNDDVTLLRCMMQV
jgi:hypothetical protein